MPEIIYQTKRISKDRMAIIDRVNEIIAEYDAMGFTLTLRQIFYQLVAGDEIPNTQKEYKRLGTILNDARLCGFMDWNAMEDRTRNIHTVSTWGSPRSLMKSAIVAWAVDRWKYHTVRPYVFIEKDALLGVVTPVCEELHVPVMSCRGYISQSEIWVQAQRMRRETINGQTPIVFHFGDHDPSGIDMSRDIEDRLRLFMSDGDDESEDDLSDSLEFHRIALNHSQIEQYNPPPNPAKKNDSRFKEYVKKYGKSSWELDALNPKVIGSLIRMHVEAKIDYHAWDAAVREEEEGGQALMKALDDLPGDDNGEE